MPTRDGFKKRVGSKLEVWRGTAKMTPGRVTKAGLIQTKDGRIRFKSKSIAAKRNRTLEKAGFIPVPGKFVPFAPRH